MILGSVVLKRRYSARECIAVGMITLGICACTLATSASIRHHNTQFVDEGLVVVVSLELFWWIVGGCGQ
jgi:hypothetical protein